MNLVEKINFYKQCRIIDVGWTFNTYVDFINEHCPENKKHFFKTGAMPDINHIYNVIKEQKNFNYGYVMCIIQDIKTEQVFLIRAEGIQLL